MKFIIFHDLKTKASSFGYHTSMKMSYLLNVNVACLGIGKCLYYFTDDAKKTDFEFKVKYLLGDNNLDDQERNTLLEIERNYKSFKKIKSKSSKQITAFQLIKRNIENAFHTIVKNDFDNIDNIFRLSLLKPLINGKEMYFYTTDLADTLDNNDPVIPVSDILQLLLPDPEKGPPLFFLNIENDDCVRIPEIEIHSPDSESAENNNCIYGAKGFTFPLLTQLSANDTAFARTQLAEPTKEFREQLEIWAEICYANPNTNKGLDYFRQKIQPLLNSLENVALKSTILKNTSDYTNENQQTQIIIGQAPIEKIWEIYKTLETITEETYNELLRIKTEQYPKFEGRWPVMFLKLLASDSLAPTTENDIVQSVRKVISVD